MAISGVVNRVVASTHYRPYLPVYAVVNIGSPQSLYEQKGYVRREMHWHQEESYHMGHCLQYTIKWVEGQT